MEHETGVPAGDIAEGCQEGAFLDVLLLREILLTVFASLALLSNLW